MKKEEIQFLNQLVKSLDEATSNMEKEYNRGNYENFNKSKKIMLRIQKEIFDIIR